MRQAQLSVRAILCGPGWSATHSLTDRSQPLFSPTIPERLRICDGRSKPSTFAYLTPSIRKPPDASRRSNPTRGAEDVRANERGKFRDDQPLVIRLNGARS